VIPPDHGHGRECNVYSYILGIQEIKFPDICSGTLSPHQPFFLITAEMTVCDLHFCTWCVSVVNWRTGWLLGLQVSINQLFKRAMPLFYRLILLCVLFVISVFAHKPFVLDFLITNVSLFSTDNVSRFYCLGFVTVNSIGFMDWNILDSTQDTTPICA
jgi:hypothetical protein